MKRIKESAKITLTIGQLKRLVKEGLDEDNIPCPSCKGTNIDIDGDGNATCLDCDYSWELKDYTDSEYIVKNLRDYACNKIIGGEADEIMNPESDGSMRRPLTDTREVERYAKDVGLSKVCVLGDELDFRHNSIEYTLYKKDGEYAVLCTELERGNGYRIHLYVVKLDGELADDARMLDDSDLHESRKRRVNEGPGAGYNISIANAEVNDSRFEIDDSGNLKASIIFSHTGEAAGYDWDTSDYKDKQWTSTIDFTIPREVVNAEMSENKLGDNLSDDEILHTYSNVCFDTGMIMNVDYGGGYIHSDLPKDMDIKVGVGLDGPDGPYNEFDETRFVIYEIGTGRLFKDCKVSGVLHFDPGFVNLVNYTYRTKDEYDEEVPESLVVKESREAKVSDFEHDSLGGGFTGCFGSMRKPQHWSIYPKGAAPDGKVYIQCKNRWGEIDVNSGILWMSAAHGFANNMSLTIDKVKGKAEQINLDKDIVDQIVDAMDARDRKRATGPERDTLLVVGDDEPEGKGPWSDPDYADYIR